MDLKETEILGADIDQHWYYRSKSNAMQRLIAHLGPSTILDIGAGSGYFSKHILSTTAAKEAWCIDISYAEDSDALESGKPVHFRKSVGNIKADLVLFMDVLEHVDNDVALLQEYAAKVPSGTHFLISVPAFQFLWSGHDVFLEHKRRYRLHQLEEVVRRAGLSVEHGSYYFGAVFPIAVGTRLLGKLLRPGPHQARSQLTRHHPVINSTLAALSKAELPLLAHNRLAGLTAFCTARKA